MEGAGLRKAVVYHKAGATTVIGNPCYALDVTVSDHLCWRLASVLVVKCCDQLFLQEIRIWRCKCWAWHFGVGVPKFWEANIPFALLLSFPCAQGVGQEPSWVREFETWSDFVALPKLIQLIPQWLPLQVESHIWYFICMDISGTGWNMVWVHLPTIR